MRVFQKKMFAIATSLEGCLGTVSTECLARGLIEREAFRQTSSAGAHHTSHYIREILSAIRVKIQEDPNNLEVFVDKVLVPMGGFADNLVAQLSECDVFSMEGICQWQFLSFCFHRNMKNHSGR